MYGTTLKWLRWRPSLRSNSNNRCFVLFQTFTFCFHQYKMITCIEGESLSLFVKGSRTCFDVQKSFECTKIYLFNNSFRIVPGTSSSFAGVVLVLLSLFWRFPGHGYNSTCNIYTTAFRVKRLNNFTRTMRLFKR